MAFGSCDCCGRMNVSISRCDQYGIETYACAHCFGYEPDDFDDEAEELESTHGRPDAGDRRTDPVAR